ncbi:GNAT family N-acetyltransferase [Planctomycetota bacterium]
MFGQGQDNEESSSVPIVVEVIIIMDESSIILRAANPTFDEGLIFASYLDEAAEGFFRFMLGRRSGHIIATVFAQPNHDLSHQNVTFAERDNVIVGMVSGYTAEQHRRSSRRPLKQASGRYNLRMRIVLVLFAPLMRIIDSIGDDDFYLQAIAVDKKLRGEGVGYALMDFIEDRARASGSTRLSLDVSAKNKGARRFYERCGMTIESQWPKRVPIPGLKFYRMIKAL